jgi:chromosome segregation ATPase
LTPGARDPYDAATTKEPDMPLGERLTLLQRRFFGFSVADLRKQIADSRNQLADLRVEFNRLRAQVQKLREELQRTAERPLEEHTLDEILALHTGCHDALERFEIHGGGGRTLREAATEAGAEIDTLVATIKNLLTSDAQGARR